MDIQVQVDKESVIFTLPDGKTYKFSLEEAERISRCLMLALELSRESKKSFEILRKNHPNLIEQPDLFEDLK